MYTEQQKQDEMVSTTTKTTKIEIYINCLIFKNSYLLHCNICMTYLCSSQMPNDRMYSLPDVVLLLATRCHYLGGKSDVISTRPHLLLVCTIDVVLVKRAFFPYHFLFVIITVVLDITTTCIYYICSFCCLLLYIWFLESSTLV